MNSNLSRGAQSAASSQIQFIQRCSQTAVASSAIKSSGLSPPAGCQNLSLNGKLHVACSLRFEFIFLHQDVIGTSRNFGIL